MSAVTTNAAHGGGPTGSASTADLVSQAAAQISTLVRDELALAKLELAEKGKRAGVGGGLLGGSAVLGWFGLALLVTLAVVLLDLVWPLWLAVLVVMVVVFAAAAVAALLGRQKLKAATPPVPGDAVAGVQADVQTIKTAARRGRHG
ncbi:phage holin family protein [Actinoplanes sichuanensis]|uniref:Phage holin family protein n=1 Tax=Actinoplanes sichuanensis TaxID=512349 RepID=A0ABW4A072_9ACTN|nr:phage holin family protein [Actinoplanes sichuanensis]